jgi:hypothetical protein
MQDAYAVAVTGKRRRALYGYACEDPVITDNTNTPSNSGIAQFGLSTFIMILSVIGITGL